MPCQRGNPAVEYVLDQGVPYVSRAGNGCHVNVLQERWVLAVAGTNGTTTTSKFAGVGNS